jgi:hypothetical protein
MMETNDSRGNEFWITVAQTGFQGMAGQKNDGERKEERPTAGTAGRDGIILPPDPAIPRQVAPQQSLLPFHRTAKGVTSSAECHENFKTRQTRLPGPGCVNSLGLIKETEFPLETRSYSRQNRISQTSIRLRNQINTGWF